VAICLDHVTFLGSNSVELRSGLTARLLLIENLLVIDSLVLLLDETLSWRVVALVVSISQLMHLVVEIN
jgi:hypothetical protein